MSNKIGFKFEVWGYSEFNKKWRKIHEGEDFQKASRKMLEYGGKASIYNFDKVRLDWRTK